MDSPGPADSPDPGDSFCQVNCTQPMVTTIFTPPTACLDYWTPVTTATPYTGSPEIFFTQNSTKEECVPSQWASCSQCHLPLSPGICPRGWLAASVGFANGVTTNHCCPSDAGNYTTTDLNTTSRCAGTITNSFKKLTYNVTLPTVTDNELTAITAGSTAVSVVFRNTSTTVETTQTIFVYTGMLAADPIIVQYKENEIPSSETPASTTSAESAPTPSQTSTTGPTSSMGSSPRIDQRTLSSGAKAGIGIGAALGVCAIIAVGFFIYRSRKRKTSSARSASVLERPELSDKPIEAKEMDNDAMKAHELPESSRQELNAHHAVVEGPA